MAGNSGTLLIESNDSNSYVANVWETEAHKPIILSNGAVVSSYYMLPVQISSTQQYIYKEEEGAFYKIIVATTPTTIGQLQQNPTNLIKSEDLNKYLPLEWFSITFGAPNKDTRPYGATRILNNGNIEVGGYVVSGSTGLWGRSSEASASTHIVYPIYAVPIEEQEVLSDCIRAIEISAGDLFKYEELDNLYLTPIRRNDEVLAQKTGYEEIKVASEIQGINLDLVCQFQTVSSQQQQPRHTFRINSKKAYAVYDSENYSLTFFKDLNGIYEDGETIDTKTYWTEIDQLIYGDYLRPQWRNLTVHTVLFRDEIAPLSTAFWFDGMESLSKIENLNLLNTSAVLTMKAMFQSCQNLKELDLSGFDTSHVGDMSFMFREFHNLKILNLRNFETSNVTNMRCTFQSTDLEHIIIGEGWDTSNVEQSENMFLDSVRLLNYDSDYTDKTRAYYSAGDGLGYLSWYREAYAKLDTEGILTFFTDYSDKYKDAFNITNLRGCTYFFNESVDISVFEEFTRFSIVIINNGQEYDGIEIDLENNYVGYLEQVFHDTTIIYSENQWLNNDYRSITIVGGSDEENPTLIEWLLDNGVFNSDSEGNKYFTGIETTNYYVDTDDISLSVLPSWNNSYRFNNYIIKKVVTQDEIFPLSTAYWFGACRNLIACDLKLLNTQNTTNMEYMFFDCDKLNKIEGLSSFDTSKVTKMSYMFNKDSALKELDLSNFNTSKVEKMGYMFSEMGGFILDISNFDFSKASTCASIFYKSSFDRIIFPQNFKPKANWSRAFGEAKLNQNIIVQSSPSSYGSLFSNLSSGSEVYIIWNGEAGEANIWQRICDTYTNAHYELNDANFAINLTGSNRGYLDEGNWVIDEGGGEIRFQLNTTLTVGKIPFGYSVSLNGSPIFRRREGNGYTTITVTQDATDLQYYYHEIPQDKRKNNWNYYALVDIVASSDDGPTLSTTMTTPDVIILGEYAAIDILPKAHTIALGKVAERKMSYTAIDNPSGNPKEQGWYEESGGVYSLTKDTTVVSGKTYYTGEENASLQIGLPIYYREHETPIGTVLTGYTTTGSITKSSSTNISHLTDIVTLPPGAWIINVKLRYPSAAAGTRGLSIRYKSLEEGSSEKNIGSSIQYFGVSQSAVHLSTTSFINTTTGATIAIGASQASGSNMTFSEWYWRCMRIL